MMSQRLLLALYKGQGLGLSSSVLLSHYLACAAQSGGFSGCLSVLMQK